MAQPTIDCIRFISIIYLLAITVLVVYTVVSNFDYYLSNLARYRLRKICQEISKQKPGKNTFKNLQHLKKLLRNKHCIKALVFNVTFGQEYPKHRRDAVEYLWGLTENRQLFNKKELKTIDRCNAEIIGAQNQTVKKEPTPGTIWTKEF